MNWGDQLMATVKAIDANDSDQKLNKWHHGYSPACLAVTQENIRQYVKAGGHTSDQRCADLYKHFAWTALMYQLGRKLDEERCLAEPAEYFINFEQAKRALQLEVSA